MLGCDPLVRRREKPATGPRCRRPPPPVGVFVGCLFPLLSNGAALCSGSGHGPQRPVLLPAHQAGRPRRGLALPPQGGLAPDAVPGPVPQLAGVLQRRHPGGGCSTLGWGRPDPLLGRRPSDVLAVHRSPILISESSWSATSTTASWCPCWHQLSTRFVPLLASPEGRWF